MTEATPNTLDFAAVDGLAFAAERGRLNGQAIPILSAQDIGPVFEFAQFASSGLLPPIRDAPFVTLNGLDQMVQAMNGPLGQWFSPSDRTGLFRTSPSPPNESIWTGFGLAAQQAAAAAGFPRAIAAQLAAALGELHSNIYEHAEAPDTGIIAFRASADRFEFVAADRGIGILKSLHNAAAYAALADHGEALRLALTDGISRFGPDAGRGHGFRPLFIGLANLNGMLRFRSGDHALLIDGRHPSLMTARTAQKPAIPGFFVSVSCTANRGGPPKTQP